MRNRRALSNFGFMVAGSVIAGLALIVLEPMLTSLWTKPQHRMDVKVAAAVFSSPPVVGDLLEVVSDHQAQVSFLRIADALGRQELDIEFDTEMQALELSQDEMRAELVRRDIPEKIQNDLLRLLDIVRAKNELAAIRGVGDRYRAVSVSIRNTGKGLLTNVGIVFDDPSYVYGPRITPESIPKGGRLALGDLRPGESFQVDAWCRGSFPVSIWDDPESVVLVNCDQAVANHKLEVLADASRLRQLSVYRTVLGITGLLAWLVVGGASGYAIASIMSRWLATSG